MPNKDVERLINYFNYFGFEQISVKPIRDAQDKALIEGIINDAKTALDSTKGNVTKEPSFFVGSVDFMVKNIDGKKTFYILEANGGSSRGFSTLPFSHWSNAYNGYTESLKYVESENPLVLLGGPNSDALNYEKFLLAEYFLEKLTKVNPKTKIIPVADFNPLKLQESPAIVIGNYKEIMPRIGVKDSYVYFDGKQVDVLIGDGTARRTPEIVKHLLESDLKTLVINDAFFVTDDKSLTYQAVGMVKDLLKPFCIEPINFYQANDFNNLYFKCRQALDELPEILIKPHGGSGGSGIDIITEKSQIKKKIESSIDHYQKKFGKDRNPYPYTICQRVNATPIKWKDSFRHFDIRVYVARKANILLPVGALMRIALEPFSGYFTKKSFVVNLSGYEGVDIDRGMALNKDSLKLFDLSKKDFTNIFCAAATLSAYIANNYRAVISEK